MVKSHPYLLSVFAKANASYADIRFISILSS